MNRVMPTAFARYMVLLLVAFLQLNAAPTQDPTPLQPETATQTGSARPSAEMLISGGDLLQVTVYGTDFDKQVRVSASGEISLPLLGAAKVAGLSVGDAEQLVAKMLSERGYFNDPQVSIFDREYGTQAISVLGEVQKPGLYPLPGTRTLFDAVSAAGGTTARAGNSVTITHRGNPENPDTVQLSYNGQPPASNNPQIFPGDTVVVSKAGIVYVVGDVRQPKGIVMENSQMTVLQAVAMAEGTNPTAAPDHSRVIRKTADGQEEIPIQLKKILAAKASDLALQPGDILFIPNSAAKSAGRRSLEAIIEAATGAAIYRPY